MTAAVAGKLPKPRGGTLNRSEPPQSGPECACEHLASAHDAWGCQDRDLGACGCRLDQAAAAEQTVLVCPSYGPVERTVRGDVEALMTEHPMGEALAEMSFNLAKTLDQGAGLAVAAVNRELRANLIELARLGVDGADDFEDQISTPSAIEDTEPSD